MHRMMHPDHGFTHVYTAQELKEYEARGWKIQTEEELREMLAKKKRPQNVTPDPVVERVNVDDLPDVEVVRKPGRPRKAA